MQLVGKHMNTVQLCTYITYVEIPENGHTPLEAVKENEVAPKCDVAGSYDLVVYCDKSFCIIKLTAEERSPAVFI